MTRPLPDDLASTGHLSYTRPPFVQIPVGLLQCSGEAVKLYLAIGSHADYSTGENAWPGLELLAEETGNSVRTVQRYVAELRTAGWITVVPRHREDGSQASNAYTLQSVATPLSPPGAKDGAPFMGSETGTSPAGVPVTDVAGPVSPVTSLYREPLTETPKNKTHSVRGADAPLRLVEVDQPTPEPTARLIVAAYVEGADSGGKGRPSGRLLQKLGRDAKRLLADGFPLAALVAAATRCGQTGWDDLDRELQQPQRGAPSQPGLGGGKLPWTDDDYHVDRDGALLPGHSQYQGAV